MGFTRRSLAENALSLLANMTEAEQALEPHIAKLGVRYRCQHLFWGLKIIPDFLLLDHGIVVEVDDPSHNRKAKREADAKKTASLEKLGWKVYRCTNAAVIANPAQVLRDILTDAGLTELSGRL